MNRYRTHQCSQSSVTVPNTSENKQEMFSLPMSSYMPRRRHQRANEVPATQHGPSQQQLETLPPEYCESGNCNSPLGLEVTVFHKPRKTCSEASQMPASNHRNLAARVSCSEYRVLIRSIYDRKMPSGHAMRGQRLPCSEKGGREQLYSYSTTTCDHPSSACTKIFSLDKH